NSNQATISSSTPANSNANSRGPTTAVTAEIDTAPAPAPIKLPAVGGNGQGAVEWTAPANGGQPITGYTLKACNVAAPTSCVSLGVGPNPNAPPAPATPTYFSYIINGL